MYLHATHPEQNLKTGHDIVSTLLTPNADRRLIVHQSTYVMRWEDYYNGLRPLSVVLALPQALMIYAGAAFYLGLIQIILEQIPKLTEAINTVLALSVGILPLLIVSGFLWSLSAGKVAR